MRREWSVGPLERFRCFRVCGRLSQRSAPIAAAACLHFDLRSITPMASRSFSSLNSAFSTHATAARCPCGAVYGSRVHMLERTAAPDSQPAGRGQISHRFSNGLARAPAHHVEVCVGTIHGTFALVRCARRRMLEAVGPAAAVDAFASPGAFLA